MTPRTFRFGQRGTAPEGEAPDQLALTPQDEENIHAYVARIHDTIDVLNREVDAIKAGNLDVVSAIFDEKSRFEVAGAANPAGQTLYGSPDYG